MHFPHSFPESTDEVLIEDFVDGRTISHYSTHPHALNKVMAMIGAKSFFEMLMRHNFVHADCHGGNILIKID